MKSVRRHCPVCGGLYAIKKDKTLRKHTRAMGAATKGFTHHPYKIEDCPGAGQEGTVYHRQDDGTWPQSPASITQCPATPGEL